MFGVKIIPRQARIKSGTGIYHIMLRGVNGQQIFEEKEDCDKFIEILKEYKAVSEYKVFAYCLMGNHIHLLMQEIAEPIELYMKRITTKFVYWYNIKYKRTGHLFQDRFKSEPVEDDTYLLTVLRYIHRNPIKAGLVDDLEAYGYSSYNEYVYGSDFIDTKYVFEIMSKEELLQFNQEESLDNCLDVEDKTRVRVVDEEAKRIIEKISKCKNATEFQLLTADNRDTYLKKFREQGLSIRQISRLTGVSFNVVRKFE